MRNGCSGSGRAGAEDEAGLVAAGADAIAPVADWGEPDAALAVPVPDAGLDDAFADPDVDVVELEVGFEAGWGAF